jgi:hypothetical protein
VTALQIVLLVCSRTAQDLAHVENSRQATPFRKGFDHYVVYRLRDNLGQLVDQLLSAATYVVDDDPSRWILFAIVVHGAQACYRSMNQSHLMKKQDHKHSSKPSGSS